jgi:hypothetical protein
MKSNVHPVEIFQLVSPHLESLRNQMYRGEQLSMTLRLHLMRQEEEIPGHQRQKIHKVCPLKDIDAR